MGGRIDRADRSERTRWLIILLVMTLAGTAAIIWLIPAITDRLASTNPERALKIGIMILSLLLIPFVLVGLAIVSLGRRTLASGRFPPPGVKVIRDTVVLQGRDARRRGYALLALGLLLTLLALYGSLYMPFKLHELVEPRGRSEELN